MVKEGSPAANGGLRFGDQILEVDQTKLVGLNSDEVISLSLLIKTSFIFFEMQCRIFIQVHKLLIKKPPGNAIKMIIRNQPIVQRFVLKKVTYQR